MRDVTLPLHEMQRSCSTTDAHAPARSTQENGKNNDKDIWEPLQDINPDDHDLVHTVVVIVVQLPS